MKNVLCDIPSSSGQEILTVILQDPGFKLERIVSFGQATPADEWLTQEKNEWVILLQGSAGLKFQSEAETRKLLPGDFLNIPAREYHRVEWTDKTTPTVWLALHY